MRYFTANSVHTVADYFAFLTSVSFPIDVAFRQIAAVIPAGLVRLLVDPHGWPRYSRVGVQPAPRSPCRLR